LYFFIKDDLRPSFDTPNQSVNLIGLNKFDSEYLEQAKIIIEDNFNLNCKIYKSLEVNQSVGNFDCGDAQLSLGYSPYKSYSNNLDIKLFITKENLHSMGRKVRGVCYGNQIYIEQYSGFKETLVHEISHSFGLKHCKNKCIMNSQSKIRWNEKINKPIYCDDCRSMLP